MAQSSGEISIIVSPIQLYAMLNGRSVSQAEIASNSWHAMPGPPRRTDLARFLQPMPLGDSAAAIRQYLAETQPGSLSAAGRGSPASSLAGSRQDAWTHHSHYSQPNAPECWIPPQVGAPDPAALNRTSAVFNLVGGGLEMVGGVMLILAPEPTMVTKVGGAALAVHSADVMQAAMRQLFSGRPVEDMTEQGVTRAARGAGLSDRHAHMVGVIVDVAVPLVVAVGVAGVTRMAAARAARAAAAEQAELAELARIAAVRAGRAILSEEAVAGKVGRVTLAEEEADQAIGKAGGHTAELHVNVDDKFLEGRAAAAKNPLRVFSRFTDKQAAEDAINECIQVNRQAMQRWAANPKLAPEFEMDLGRTIGRGFSKSSGKFVELTKVRVVLRMSKVGPKTFFIISSYPIP